MIGNLNKFDLLREIKRIFFILIGSDRKFIWVAVFYGFSISLLTLAVPVCVQVLINSVAYTASREAVIILSGLLLALLLCSGFLVAVQSYILELFERRVYARLSSEITLLNILTDHQYSENTDKSDLTNRYFDIMTVQKNVPSLIVGLFAFFLQTIVGILVVSSYHSFLLLFNACFVALVILIWRVWGYDALFAAVKTSDAKYKTAQHLENIARDHDYFSSHSHSQYATEKTDNLVEKYLKYRKVYFGLTFRQQISFLALYAFSSAGLLGIGGMIVIDGQITLGQLVSAELILSAIFYGAIQLNYSLTSFYELGAALEEIYRIYQMPFEKSEGQLPAPTEAFDVQFYNAKFFDDNEAPLYFNFTIQAGHKVIVTCATHKIQQSIMQTIMRYQDVQSGRILLGGQDIRDINPRKLRDVIVILDKITVFNATIREYLTLNKNDIKSSDIYNVLEIVGLNLVIDKLDHGIDASMSVGGYPFSPSEVLQLKLASILLLKPKAIILNQLFDIVPVNVQRHIFSRLKEIDTLTIIYFSNRDHNNTADIFDEYLYINGEQ
ncbi:MAG: putative ABC transport system ATP-binding protein [Alphaproteobacteria bacterium]|jgi:putative ABC transport system ATP-binding protein